jgi:hypothetical protein
VEGGQRGHRRREEAAERKRLKDVKAGALCVEHMWTRATWGTWYIRYEPDDRLPVSILFILLY